MVLNSAELREKSSEVKLSLIPVCYRLDVTPTDPRWVGAWWIGFLAAGLAALSVVPLMLAFPRELPGNAVNCLCLSHVSPAMV